VAAAAERGLPLLGICRGAQVLNVALGGTLVQDLPTVTDGVDHRVAGRWGEVVHDVRIADDSLLAGVVGTDRLGVNSLHHQAVASAGHGLRIVAWATDGIAEAIEGTHGWSVLGVQWHPELLAEFTAHAALFEWLVARSAVSLLAVADAA
jgi:putative glutamine amidotransferase